MTQMQVLKQRSYLLGANAITKNKAGEPLDFCVVRLCMKAGEGAGWEQQEFFYGRAIDAKGINHMVENGVTLVDCDFVPVKDYKNGGFRLALNNFTAAK